MEFKGDRLLELQTFPDPAPGPGEVVLEIKASGMCGSDLKFYRSAQGEAMKALGFSPGAAVIAGHEPCGVVVAVGANVNPKQARVGQRVMVHHYRGCGACPHCSTGWMQLCVEGVAEVYGVTDHGGHAKYMKCPAATLVTLPEELSFETGAAISCGTGTAWGALHRLQLTGDQVIAIFGQGPVGLSATQLAAALVARVIALDVSADRLARARELGAAETINPMQVDVVDAIKSLTQGLGAHAALDASSSSDARRQAVQSVRTWGKVCLVGEGGQITLDVSPDLLTRVSFVQRGLDQVEVKIAEGAGQPRPPTLKALVGLTEGFMTEEMVIFADPGALSRAQATQALLQERFTQIGLIADAVRFDYLGINAVHREASPPVSVEPYEVVLRVAIKTGDRAQAEQLRREIDPLAVNGVAGTGKWATSAPGSRVRPVIGLSSCLVPRDAVQPSIVLFDASADRCVG